MSANATEPEPPTIAGSANRCLQSFQQCLYQASLVHPRELSMVEDQLARFSAWAASIGVFASGRASMDHRLRFAPEVQSIVVGLLEALEYRTRECSDVLGVNKVPQQSTVVKSKNLDTALGYMAAETSRLHKISNTIRRAGKESQNLKASNFQIRDDEGNDAEPLLRALFEHHIRDRFPTVSDAIRRRLARTMLLRRRRILYRRSRLGTMPARLLEVVPQASIALPTVNQTFTTAGQSSTEKKKIGVAVAQRSTMQSQANTATTLAPGAFASTPSVVSATKTVALGDHEALAFPPAPGAALKRKYISLEAAREASETAMQMRKYAEALGWGKQRTSVPEASSEQDLPASSMELDEEVEVDLQTIGEVTCPFCSYALPAQDVFDDKKWIAHVKNDLDPYVCLFEECDKEDELYSHSDKWLKHMQTHALHWRCTSHRDVAFSTREEYLGHMRESHNTKLTDKQLRVLADRSALKAGRLFESCPLCGQGNTNGRLEDHIVGHLRSLALKSLPSYEEVWPDESGNDQGSSRTSQARSRSTMKQYNKSSAWPEEGHVIWEDPPRELRDPAIVKLLNSETLSYTIRWEDVIAPPAYNAEDDPIIHSMVRARDEALEVALEKEFEEELRKMDDIDESEISEEDDVGALGAQARPPAIKEKAAVTKADETGSAMDFVEESIGVQPFPGYLPSLVLPQPNIRTPSDRTTTSPSEYKIFGPQLFRDNPQPYSQLEDEDQYLQPEDELLPQALRSAARKASPGPVSFHIRGDPSVVNPKKRREVESTNEGLDSVPSHWPHQDAHSMTQQEYDTHFESINPGKKSKTDETSPGFFATHLVDRDVVWRGSVTLLAIADFEATATFAGGFDFGAARPWSELIPEKLTLAGRILAETADEYLCSLQYSTSTEITVVRITATDLESMRGFDKVFDYFSSRDRYGVVGTKATDNTRDTYVVPLAPGVDGYPPFLNELYEQYVPRLRFGPWLLVVFVWVKEENQKAEGPTT